MLLRDVKLIVSTVVERWVVASMHMLTVVDFVLSASDCRGVAVRGCRVGVNYCRTVTDHCWVDVDLGVVSDCRGVTSRDRRKDVDYRWVGVGCRLVCADCHRVGADLTVGLPWSNWSTCKVCVGKLFIFVHILSHSLSPLNSSTSSAILHNSSSSSQFNNSFWLDNSIVSKYCIGTVWLRCCNNKLTFQGRYRSQIFLLCRLLHNIAAQDCIHLVLLIFLDTVPSVRYRAYGTHTPSPIFRNPQIRYGWRWSLRVPHISKSLTRYGLTVRVRRRNLSLSAQNNTGTQVSLPWK